MKSALIAITTALFATQSLAASASASESEILAKRFMVDQVSIIEGGSESDFANVAYSDEGPTLALLVARTSDANLYYMEPSDVGGALVSVERDSHSVEIVKQGHQIRCSDVIQTFEANNVVISFCK